MSTDAESGTWCTARYVRFLLLVAMPFDVRRGSNSSLLVEDGLSIHACRWKWSSKCMNEQKPLGDQWKCMELGDKFYVCHCRLCSMYFETICSLPKFRHVLKKEY